jgi:hypothetical protein
MKTKLLSYAIILLALTTVAIKLPAADRNMIHTSYVENNFFATALNESFSTPFTTTYTKTNVSVCGCGRDGTITVTPTGNSAYYIYEWTGTDGYSAGNAASVYNLPVGYYNVSITDAYANKVIITGIHIEFAFAVHVTNNGTVSGNCGNSGTVILYGNDGIEPYTYSMNGTSFQCSNTFSGLAPGNYTAYVRDLAGCLSTKAVTVGIADPLSVSPFARNSSTCAADGSIEIYLTGGVPPYVYSLNNITYQANNKFMNLAAGSYTAYVKDSKGCVASKTITVSLNTPVTITTRKINTSTCVNNGAIIVTAGGGEDPYTYSKNGTTFQASNSFFGLASGNYTVTVKDSKNCIASARITISLAPVIVTASAANASSCLINNGKIQLFSTGGFGPFTYSIDGDDYQSSNVFNNLHAGTYTVYVKDSKFCIGMLNGIFVGPSGCTPILSPNTKIVKTSEVNIISTLSLQAFPNPSVTEFTLIPGGFNNNEKIAITVTDLLGRTVYQAEGTGKKLYRFGKDFKVGMYNVQVVQGIKQKNLKLIKE